MPVSLFSDPNAFRALVLWVTSVSEKICHVYFTTACLSHNVSSCRSQIEAWLSTALLNSQPLLATYPFLPVFSACCFHDFWGRGKFSPFSPSAHTLLLPHPADRGRNGAGDCQQSKRRAVRVWGAALSAVCYALESSLQPSGGPGSIIWETLTGRNRLSLF